jgi:hypothetical protein
MKKIITIVFVFTTCFLYAQAYKGKGDKKFQVGALVQSDATGISASLDFGLGENFSVGLVTSYLLDVKTRRYSETEFYINNPTYDPIINGYPDLEEKSDFVDRIDLKARFSANIGNVIGLPANMDVYPGLNLGLRNFGGHAGFRYFFTNGFGVFGETSFPIAKYDQNISGYDSLNNQFTFCFGASFNL